MIFEVRKDGQIKMASSDPRCIYDEETCKQMRAAGYKVTLDGKPYPPRRPKEEAHS